MQNWFHVKVLDYKVDGALGKVPLVKGIHSGACKWKLCNTETSKVSNLIHFLKF